MVLALRGLSRGKVRGERGRAGQLRALAETRGAVSVDGSHSSGSRRATRVVLVFILALAGLALAASPAGAAFPGQNGAVYFTRANGDNSDIYAVRPDRSIVQITSS